MGIGEDWPELPPPAWRETYPTLHMWTQIVGKICLELTPLVNHYWNIAFHLAPHGLTTLPIAIKDRTFAMIFDFLEHRLVIACSDGTMQSVTLKSQTTADFYRLVMKALRDLGIDVRIWTVPCEVPNPIRFEDDLVHATYDPQAAAAFWRILRRIGPVFEAFRANFIGKCSPVHFFWGSFDLAVTRFSGRRAPERPGADEVTRESYSHEVISHGFWPGSGSIDEPCFYAYAVPQPEGFSHAEVRPSSAAYNATLSEFILPYRSIASANSPDAELLAFMGDTYVAAATLAGWDRKNLERTPESP